ncbi:hypothetical protein HYFRA_00000148 [Hymenoscyphus fraxineus]|uniref:FAD-binding domain-containing protein n=1 Tax=Hymenoscyphus fraxineus TaxID=746836 RepID=A0A9N9L1L8_9HELO|nr:hypothetical protein HYFRA_00000148 [Hymenoscyphus fraxineus]
MMSTYDNCSQIIIAGGSITGLTLAHCLHHANIDYVVLEARKEIAPQIGASIVILPNGARILDQLGIGEDVLALSETVEGELDWTGDGKLLTPLENYHAADNHMTQIGKVKLIIPTILLPYILPSIAMFMVSSLSTRLWIHGVFWQPFPIYAQVTQLILGRFVSDTTEIDRIQNPEADMPYLRRIYAFAAVVAAITSVYTRFNLPGYLPSAASCAGLYWILIHFMDLKVAGKLNARWVGVICVLAGLFLTIGPGATVIAVWAWREEVLAAKKRRGISEKYRVS